MDGKQIACECGCGETFMPKQGPGRPRRFVRTSHRLKAVQKLLTELKSKPCMDCKQTFDPVCMDFDHRDPTQKVIEVTQLRNSNTERILEEIAKCDLVCANCHRLRS